MSPPTELPVSDPRSRWLDKLTGGEFQFPTRRSLHKNKRRMHFAGCGCGDNKKSQTEVAAGERKKKKQMEKKTGVKV